MNREALAIRSGHGLWSEPGFPHKGWSFVGIEDLEEVSGACQACHTPIRYVHYLEHDDYPEVIGVGCVCAGHLQEDHAAARLRERSLRNTTRRRKAWLRKPWKVSAKGNEYINIEGFNIVVYPHHAGFSGRVADLSGSLVKFLERDYPTVAEAKAAAFDLLPRWISEPAAVGGQAAPAATPSPGGTS